MEKIWRLIVDGALDPYLNMAIDEAIMLRQAHAGSQPTLRIYRWLYPCVSVGRFQKPLTLTLSPKGRGEGEGDNNLPVVKRPTGGGAVIHNEFSFTYSVIYREDSGIIPRGVSNSYREIHAGVLEGLKGLGIEANFYLNEKKNPKSPVGGGCFISPVEFDVMCGGRKIAGAAQRRKFGVVLHQGEVSLGLDVWSKWSYNNFLIAFTSGLSRHLKAEFLKGQISDMEISLAEELIAAHIEEVNR
ncbi:MAG: lipoate--protein ligase family protein [Candidatus Omnitrophota bacterium]|nr:lipoate--protein ligase family protein [Candidatus Omnitrophota bacterium]